MRKKQNGRRVLAALAACLLFLSTGCATKTPEGPVADPIDDNYRTFYQIFVGSYSDANGDGIGDIRGIINRFDVLNDGDMTSDKSLGVQGIWLSPIFSSPSYHKYDTKDYYTLDWRFGTESDLVELITLCHERNVKLILDLVINHTSTQHEWFIKFKQARLEGDTQSEYYDFYSCATAADRRPGVQYQKIAGVDCYYECNFSSEMPELNFDNPFVRQSVLDVAEYYLALGVDGFRFDAVKYIYYGDTARSVEFWEWLMQQLKAIEPDIYCVGECWSGETEILEYCGEMNCFNFATSQAEGTVAAAAKGFSISNFTNYVEGYQQRLAQQSSQAMPVSFLSNHDMDRIAGVFITENHMRMAANLYLLSPGSPFIYYGEEIGLRGSRGGANTDANRRLAMRWGDGDFVRDPVGADYPQTNQIKTTLAEQIEDENSLFRYYCRLLTVRHTYPELARGQYQAVSCSNKNLGGFLIQYEDQTLVLIHNTSMQELTVDLSQCKDLGGYTVSKLCEVVGVSAAELQGSVLTVGPQTSVILR